MEDKQSKWFLGVYEAHADAIFRHCYFRVFSREKAEDLMQETFARAWEYFAGGKKADNIRAFLYRVATNLIIDAARKKKDESLEAVLERDASREPREDARSEMEIKMLVADAMEVIKDMRPEEKEILLLRYVDDLGPKEIAEALGISANNASVRLNRATESLRKKFFS